jgi:hypothetical protein
VKDSKPTLSKPQLDPKHSSPLFSKKSPTFTIHKNALNDAVKVKIPVVALCSTNNNTHNIDFVIPCNNKTANSIGLVLYLLAKLYLEKRDIKKKLQDKFAGMEVCLSLASGEPTFLRIP